MKLVIVLKKALYKNIPPRIEAALSLIDFNFREMKVVKQKEDTTQAQLIFRR